MDAIDAVLRADDSLAVLSRDVAVRLVNISASGCLLETDSRLREGTTGSLRLVFEGIDYADDVRVVRCTENEGARGYSVGAEFLWTTNPGERTLRRVLATLQPSALKPGQVSPTERN